MSGAADRGARVAHFPEGALSGYAGTDFESFAGFDWNGRRTATDVIAEHSRRLGLWLGRRIAEPWSATRARTTAPTPKKD